MADRIGVAVDVSAVPAAPVGAGRYTIELVEALSRLDEVELSVVSRRDDPERWRRLVPRAEVLGAAPSRRPGRLLFGELRLGAALGQLARAPSVLHGPHYSLPRRSPCPTVVTVHDLTFLDHPEWHEPSKVVFFRRALRRAAGTAGVVVCVSEATAARFEESCSPVCPVLVVPHGVDHGRFRPARLGEVDGGEMAESDAGSLARLGVRRPYVLHLGTLEPRKDLGRLVTAFDVLAGRHPELSLVLAGRDGWGLGPFEEALARARHRGRVSRLGYVADADVPALLRGAAAVAYPSLEEGFGLPALEALATGSPLVTTTGSVMAELAKGAAFLAEPGPIGSLVDRLDEAVSGGAEVDRRRILGLEVAAGHTWEGAGRGHVHAYEMAAHG